MSTLLESYLKAYRRKSALSQDEVAFLLGTVSGTRVSRYERRARRPLLETAFAYEVIFRTPVKELFAGIYQKVETETIARAQLLSERLAEATPKSLMSRKQVTLQLLTSGSPAWQEKLQ